MSLNTTKKLEMKMSIGTWKNALHLESISCCLNNQNVQQACFRKRFAKLCVRLRMFMRACSCACAHASIFMYLCACMCVFIYWCVSLSVWAWLSPGIRLTGLWKITAYSLCNLRMSREQWVNRDEDQHSFQSAWVKKTDRRPTGHPAPPSAMPTACC